MVEAPPIPRPGQTGTDHRAGLAEQDKRRTGIIYFFGYWRQEGDSADALSGGHIDLWNKDTLTPSAASFWRFRIGVPSMINPLDYLRGRRGNWYSDLANSNEILFWEVE